MQPDTPAQHPPRRIKRAERAAEYLRNEILSGRFQHGESLPSEANLMKMFDVSRPTLREGIRILESMGLVTVLRGKHGGPAVRHPGIRVATTSASDYLQIGGATLRELQQARSMIEPELIRNLPAPLAPDRIAGLHSVLKEARAVSHDGRAYVGCMTRFHTQLVSLLGNRVLDLIVSMIHRIYEPLVAAATAEGIYGSGSAFLHDIEQQERLVELLEQCDLAAAADHCRANLARIAHAIEEKGAGAIPVGSRTMPASQHEV